MFTEGTVTVVIAAAGHHNLAKCISSVRQQTYAGTETLVVIDGPERDTVCRAAIDSVPRNGNPVHVLTLPHATGRDNWCGHRIYGAASFLVNTEFIAFLDEDNWFERDHIQSLLDVIRKIGAMWGFSLRNIADEQGNLIVPDLCESLGSLHSVCEHPAAKLIDTSCYLLHREVAVQVSPVWYGPTRSPGEMERDQALCRSLLTYFPKVACNLKHTMNYTVGTRADSVNREFFIRGNESMRKMYPAGMPWEINL